MKVSNIRVSGTTIKLSVECPECKKENTYFVHSGKAFEVQRLCYGCGAILTFSCEEESKK